MKVRIIFNMLADADIGMAHWSEHHIQTLASRVFFCIWWEDFKVSHKNCGSADGI
jgi:hypothetical protein